MILKQLRAYLSIISLKPLTFAVVLSIVHAMMSHFYSRIQRVKVPYDIGRIPSNINGKTNLTSFTADQWKNFPLIYAWPCLSGLLSTNAYKSICLLCEIVELIAKPIYNIEDITTLYRKWNDHHKMYASVYGKWEVSVNYHFALHIPDLISDYGPPQVYWSVHMKE